eukprot:CAMPEP_0195144718 /NCGR_PEP_ID=MMETSP0448-20130528/168607_1 /TAXON_ID=66468 /ORGANISM="Heterocapsa triquestra, Strain CCMP 448" /LENGTH=168 /DNA_ID=CAMNT_0040183205 /DNA_START=89 /DNA_END=591 /DNA_ORIENTATION=-
MSDVMVLVGWLCLVGGSVGTSGAPCWDRSSASRCCLPDLSPSASGSDAPSASDPQPLTVPSAPGFGAAAIVARSAFASACCEALRAPRAELCEEDLSCCISEGCAVTGGGLAKESSGSRSVRSFDKLVYRDSLLPLLPSLPVATSWPSAIADADERPRPPLSGGADAG